jgi:hypothetical protein
LDFENPMLVWSKPTLDFENPMLVFRWIAPNQHWIWKSNVGFPLDCSNPTLDFPDAHGALECNPSEPRKR